MCEWMTGRRRTAGFVAAAGLLLAPWSSAGDTPERAGTIGLSVAPGGLAIQHVRPGETYGVAEQSGVMLRISNHDTKPRTYRLSTHRPSAVGNRKWLPGYLEIPDPAWFWFEQEELTIQPESEGAVHMYLRVPEGAQYYNQHWTVSIGVQGVSQAGDMLALAVYPRYQIETEPAADSEAVPAGPLGLAPSVLRFENPPDDTEQERFVTLSNNGGTRRRYTLSVKIIAVDPARERISVSPGYAWLPNPQWVSVRPRRVAIEGRQRRTVGVRVRLPAGSAPYGAHWEALLWVEPDEGLPQFVRLQVERTPTAVNP